MDENTKLKKMLEWVIQEEEDAGKSADKAYEANRESAYIRYNYVWATFGKVRKYIENLMADKI
jgi:hypothetical protein